MRGASNAVFSLDEETAKKGVATHSSGNFAQALSLAARKRGIKAYVVMPENSPQVKKDAVAGYGAEITFCKPTQLAREETLKQVVERTGATFIHPYNNETVIAGQGTAGLELIEQAPRLDALIVPVGGGGLISGNAISFSAMSPDTLVYAAEPAGADDAYRSFRAGEIIPSVNPDTIADGLLTSLGSLTFPIIRELVKDIITVTDERIIAAMRLIWERMKIIVEPSAAVTVPYISPYPKEYREVKPNTALLSRLAEETGGEILEPQSFEEGLKRLFTPEGDSGRSAQDTWWALAVLALFLFLADLALRRFRGGM